ncbi:MAG: hypothetical protein IT318_06320 [Anaerolineales bacterium]|nr:hypothetical protein [Anaerolineales bacterium]
MGPISPSNVVLQIRSLALRLRVGLWLMPLSSVGHEAAEAARLGVDAVDLRERLLGELPEGARFAGLSWERVVELIDEVISTSGAHDAVLVYNLDLLLARLSYSDRRQAWQHLGSRLPHRTRGLLLVVPDTADELLPPPEQLASWQGEGLVAQ